MVNTSKHQDRTSFVIIQSSRGKKVGADGSAGERRQRSSVLVALWGAAMRLSAYIRDWAERTRQRRLLLSLSDRALRDIAISRLEANWEGGKSFWHDRPPRLRTLDRTMPTKSRPRLWQD